MEGRTETQGKAKARRDWIPWLLFFVAFSLRIAVCVEKFGLGRIHPRDYLEYVHAGERLLEYGTILTPLTFEVHDTSPSAIMPPGYVGLVAAVFGMFGPRSQPSILTLQLVNALATSLTAVLAYGLAKRMAGRRSASLVGLIACVNPSLLGYTWLIWDTSVFALAATGTLWIVVLWLPRAVHGAAWLGFGLWLGVLAHLNPALTSVYPLLVLWPLHRRYGPALRRYFLPVGFSVLGWLVASTPWTVRNYVHFGRLIYVRSGMPLELWAGFCPEADRGGVTFYEARFPLFRKEEEARLVEMGEEKYVAECGRLAVDAIRSDPGRSLRLVGMRIIDYTLGTVFGHSTSGSGWPDRRDRVAVMLFFTMETAVVLGLVIWAVWKRRWAAEYTWLIGIVELFSLVYCVTHVQIRFRAPVESVMAVLIGLLAFAGDRRRPDPWSWGASEVGWHGSTHQREPVRP